MARLFCERSLVVLSSEQTRISKGIPGCDPKRKRGNSFSHTDISEAKQNLEAKPMPLGIGIEEKLEG